MVAILIPSVLVCLTALVVDAAPAKGSCGFPNFVYKYAPLSHLHSNEQYWPSDVKLHLTKVIPEINFKPVGGTPTLQTLSTLSKDVSLTATKEDLLAHNTSFFRSTYGKPTDSGYSAAPGTIIVVDKGGGIIDAFYFYFYSWNSGNT